MGVDTTPQAYDLVPEVEAVEQPPQGDVVIVQNRQLPRVNEWAVGQFSCFQDIGLCCDVYWCGMCQQSRLHDSIIEGRQDSFNAAVCCGMTLAGLWLGSWVCCVHAWYLRDALRAQHGIKGNACTDCLSVTFCTPCMLCQAHRQMKAHGGNPGYTCCESSTPVSQPPGVVQSGFVQPVQGVPMTA